jgi:5-methylcytosine-specific restriction enzyme subunit McrC
LSDAPPTLRLREWQSVGPSDPGQGGLLRDLRLTDADRELLAALEHRSSLRVRELQQGLMVEIGAHIGCVNLSCMRIVVLPKIRLANLMRLVAYALDISELALAPQETAYARSEEGLADLIGLSLRHAVERVARGGLLPQYVAVTDDIGTPRGRIDLRHAATRPPRTVLRCTYDDFTMDHRLNQVLAAGLRLAANVVDSQQLGMDLARAADRIFGDIARIPLSSDAIASTVAALDRRSSHYGAAVKLTALIYEATCLGEYTAAGEMPLSSFLLNMNMVFERFLEKHLGRNAPYGLTVVSQDSRSDVFSYLENPMGWKHPSIRPDLVFRHDGEVIAVGDAKYKNRHEHPPTAAELYQLTTYGLAYEMRGPREVLLFHPLNAGDLDRRTRLLFAPRGAGQRVQIRLVGVPIDAIFGGELCSWWPELPAVGTRPESAKLLA